MTLGRLVVAWVLVAVWFGLATFLFGYVVARMAAPPGSGLWVAVTPQTLKRRLIEATLLTLIASLWFESLGSGEWWLVFLLIGALATLSSWYRSSHEIPITAVITGAIGELVRYVIAGALLAWRLS